MFASFGRRTDAKIVERFAHNGFRRPAWIERSGRILKDHLHGATRGMQVAASHAGKILPKQLDGTAIGTVKTHDHAAKGGFPTAAFTDKRDGFAWGNRQGDVVDRMNGLALAGSEMPYEVLGDQDIGFVTHAGTSTLRFAAP